MKFERITVDPNVMGGQPCIRGLRIPVSLIIKLIAAGNSIKDILRDYPELEEEDIKQALEFAAWITSKESILVSP
ncbi:MAG: DUF433 domain-containing protein [Candidatus Hydrothermarchaeota archaeon]|nr:MAG: DUF433 domain-containing protein [Candidatus Hydrothermarchaeota archaeon]